MRYFPILLVSAALPSFACGLCGCSTHTDWATQGLWTGPGFRLALRYDYFNQDQLRSGRKTVDRGAFDLPAEQELQQQTINRNLTLGLDWSPSAEWGLAVAVPYVHRTHETLAEGDTEQSASRHVGLSDIRVLGRYQGFGDDHAFGVQFGLKLPTGKKKDRFLSGPQTDELVDRGLQLGTGTTDVLLGLFKFGMLSEGWGYFLQAQFQAATGESEGFRPGNAFTFSAGVRRGGQGRVSPQLQLNVRTEKPESGINSDAANSGSTLAHLSPGLVVTVNAQLTLSAFVQLPVYQRVSGLQLEPKVMASAQVSYTF